MLCQLLLQSLDLWLILPFGFIQSFTQRTGIKKYRVYNLVMEFFKVPPSDLWYRSTVPGAARNILHSLIVLGAGHVQFMMWLWYLGLRAFCQLFSFERMTYLLTSIIRNCSQPAPRMDDSESTLNYLLVSYPYGIKIHHDPVVFVIFGFLLSNFNITRNFHNFL